MTESSENIAKPVEILVAKNLPIINTGRVPLAINPLKGGPTVATVGVNSSALLVPGDYLVVPVHGFNPKGYPPIAEISYDRKLHHCNVKVLPEPGVRAVDGQFSIVVNLTDLRVGPVS